MRKLLALMIAAGLAASLVALPASAANKHKKNQGKKKKIEESFSVTLLPFPKLAAWGDPVGLTKPGCLAGQEGVNWETVTFEAPAAGTLTAHTDGFTGDWDLYLTDPDGEPLVRSENDQATQGEAPEETVTLKLKPKQVVGITPCNWLGQPENEVHYEFVFTGIGKKKGKHKNH